MKNKQKKKLNENILPVLGKGRNERKTFPLFEM